MVCPSCSHEIPDTSDYCPNCGIPFKRKAQASPPPPQYSDTSAYSNPQYNAASAKKPVSRGILVAGFFIALLTGNTIATLLTAISLIYFERVIADELAGNVLKRDYNIDIIRKLNIAAWILILFGFIVVIAAVILMIMFLIPTLLAVAEDGGYYSFDESMIYGLMNAFLPVL